MPAKLKTNKDENLGDIRAKIEEMQLERRATELAPRSRGEALEMVDRHVEKVGQVSVNIERFTDPGFNPGAQTITNSSSIEAALCRMAPDLVKEFLRDELANHLEGGPQGLGAAARSKTIERLDQQILALEVREELLVCEMEASGAEIDRRAEVPPEVFLEISDEDDEAA